MPGKIETTNYIKAYEKMSDEEIIEIIKQGNKDAERYICDKFEHTAKKIISSFYIIGGEKSDLLQEAMIGLIKAVRQYDKNHGAKFSTFAELCMRRHVIDVIRKSSSNKNSVLNECISIYQYEDDDDTRCLLDKWSDVNCMNPENVVMKKEQLSICEDLRARFLSDFESQVFGAYLSGSTLKEIALDLDKDEKAIDNAIQRVKKKAIKLMEKMKYSD